MKPHRSYEVRYSDATGKEYTETATSPMAVATREEELTEAGYTVNDD